MAQIKVAETPLRSKSFIVAGTDSLIHRIAWQFDSKSGWHGPEQISSSLVRPTLIWMNIEAALSAQCSFKPGLLHIGWIRTYPEKK